MRKVLLILRREFREATRRTSYILLTISIPLIAILGYGVYELIQLLEEPSSEQVDKIGFVDNTSMFHDYSSPLGLEFTSYEDEEKAKDDLLADEIMEYIVIPEDYVSTGTIIRFTMETPLGSGNDTSQETEGFLLTNLLEEQVDDEILERVEVPMVLATLSLNEDGELAGDSNEFDKFFLPLVFGVLFTFSIFFTSGFLLQSVAEEKETRVIEIILSSVSSRQLLAGKVLGLGGAGLLQVLVWLTSLRIFSQVASVNIPALEELSLPIDVLAFGILYFIAGYLLFAALLAGLGSIGSTARESQSWSAIFTLPAVAPLWLNFLIVSNPEGAFARALTLFPLTAPITAMMRIPSHSIAPWELALSLFILGVSIILSMWISAKVLRAFLLMYGKRPSVREIAKCVRQA